MIRGGCEWYRCAVKSGLRCTNFGWLQKRRTRQSETSTINASCSSQTPCCKTGSCTICHTLSHYMASSIWICYRYALQFRQFGDPTTKHEQHSTGDQPRARWNTCTVGLPNKMDGPRYSTWLRKQMAKPAQRAQYHKLPCPTRNHPICPEKNLPG